MKETLGSNAEKQAFIQRLQHMFNGIVTAQNEPQILGFILNLTHSIQAGFGGRFTKADADLFDRNTKVKVEQIAKNIPEARKTILLAELKKAGLEPEYLEILQKGEQK